MSASKDSLGGKTIFPAEVLRVLTLRLVAGLYCFSLIMPAVQASDVSPSRDDTLFGFQCFILGFVFGVVVPVIGLVWLANWLLGLGFISLSYRRGWLASASGLLALSCGLPVFCLVNKLLLGGYVWLASLVLFLLGATGFAFGGIRRPIPPVAEPAAAPDPAA